MPKIKALAVAVGLATGALATMSVQAAQIAPDGLFFSAFNGLPSNASSIVINLGEVTGSFAATQSNPRNLTGASLASLTTWLSGVTDLTKVKWTVAGAAGTGPTPSTGGLSTSTDIETIFPDWGNSIIGPAAGNYTTFRNNVNGNLLPTGVNAFSNSNQTQYFFVSQGGGPGFESRGKIGDSLPFYSYFADPADPDFSGAFSKLAGKWSLNFSTVSGANLSYSASAVPVPAAIWLLGSGVMGMTAVSRRRKS